MSISKFRFNNPKLMQTTFIVNNQTVFEKDKPVPMNLHLSRDISSGKDENEVIVSLTLRINCDEQDKLLANAPFAIVISYAAQFAWDGDVDAKQKEIFLAVNAPTLLLSYIRPLVTQLTACSPYPEYQVPFIDMIQLFGKDIPNT